MLTARKQSKIVISFIKKFTFRNFHYGFRFRSSYIFREVSLSVSLTYVSIDIWFKLAWYS